MKHVRLAVAILFSAVGLVAGACSPTPPAAAPRTPPVSEMSAATPPGGAPETVDFTPDGSRGTGGATIVSYAWDFGDGSTSTDMDPTHVYVDPGTYNPSLIVTDNHGLTGQSFLQLDIGPHDDPPVAVVAYSQTAPLTISFDSSGSTDDDGTIVGYQWDFGDGSNSTDADPVHVYLHAGQYDVGYSFTDDRGVSSGGQILIDVS